MHFLGTIVLCMLLMFSYLHQGTALATTSTEAADRAAIQQLHNKDLQASRVYDAKTLASLWTEDIIALPPCKDPVRGKEAGRSLVEASGSTLPDYEVLEYIQDWKELKLLGDYAYEWGLFSGAARLRKTGKIFRQKYHVMRILQRQPDGSWKVHRSIWNQAWKQVETPVAAIKPQL